MFATIYLLVILKTFATFHDVLHLCRAFVGKANISSKYDTETAG